jgi:hypothetical protein
VPIILVSAALIFLPGFLVAYFLRCRNFVAVALAPLFSTAIIGAAGILAGLAGIPWNTAVYASGAALVAGTAFVVSRCLRTRADHTASADLESESFWYRFALPLGAAGLGGVLIFRRLTKLIGQPDHMAQVIDNIFHLNAIRYILESGNASSLTLGAFQDMTPVYPAAWHTVVAMTAQLTGASLPVAENATNLIVAAVIWPVGCVFLARTLFGTGRCLTVVAGILSAAHAAFPFLLYIWGPLFPNALSMSLLPAALAVVIILFRRAESPSDPPEIQPWILALLLAFVGLGSAHMSAVSALLLFALPLVVSTVVRQWRSDTRNVIVLATTSVLSTAVAAAIWMKLRPPTSDLWGPHQSLPVAVLQVVVNRPAGAGSVWLVSVLALVGVITALRGRQQRWFIVSYLAAAILYVVDATVPRGIVREFLTGPWYQDTYRLAAFLPLFATVFGALGAQEATRWIQARCQADSMPSVVKFTGILSATALLAGVCYMGPSRMYVHRSYGQYRFDAESSILSPAELEFIQRLDQYVEKDAVIADNPWNGSSLAYAFAGRQVLTPHVNSNHDNERTLISQELGAGNFTPELCDALRNKKVKYILDFGPKLLLKVPDAYSYPGVTVVLSKPGLEVVARQGSAARLIKVTGCGA